MAQFLIANHRFDFEEEEEEDDVSYSYIILLDI
jgi:hypothetical protein